MPTSTEAAEQTPQEVTPKDEPLAKEELEQKKLLLEIKDLERPFWKRPAYVLAALPTLLAVITLTVGFINGFFSAQLTKLENQKHDIEVQIKDFEKTRAQLDSENERLQTELTKKQKTIQEIRRIVSDLHKIATQQILDQFDDTLVADRKMPSGEIRQLALSKAKSEFKLRKLIADLDSITEEANK